MDKINSNNRNTFTFYKHTCNSIRTFPVQCQLRIGKVFGL